MGEDTDQLIADYLEVLRKVRASQSVLREYAAGFKLLDKWLDEPDNIAIEEDALWYPREMKFQSIKYQTMDFEHLRNSVKDLQATLPEAGRLRDLLVNAGADLESIDAL